MRCAKRYPSLRHTCIAHSLRYPKVRYLRYTIRAYQHVLWLHISVYQPRFVRSCQPCKHPTQHSNSLTLRQRCSLCYQLLEVVSGHVLHSYEVPPLA